MCTAEYCPESGRRLVSVGGAQCRWEGYSVGGRGTVLVGGHSVGGRGTV